MDDKLERILEEGIASYAAGEPLIGLPKRILGRIGMAGRVGRRNLGWGGVFCAGVAGMAWLLMLPAHKEIVRPVQMAAVPSAPAGRVKVLAEPVAGQIGQPVGKPIGKLVGKAGAKHAKALPKLRVFPTPTPLTAEERGLMALIKQDPEGTAAAFESLHKKSEPLEIEEIVVEPLEQ
jgi:hypothetical protein